jgi:hypothetical protein
LRGHGATLPAVWHDDINTGGKPGEERTLTLKDFDPEIVASALWLADRYEKTYGPKPPADWKVISTEEWLTAEYHGVKIVGRTDGLFEDGEGRLWLREVKSYGRKGRLNTIGVEPQLTIYYMLVEQKYGRAPDGIMFDGVYTYRWKPTMPTQAALIEEREQRDPTFATWRKSDQRDWAREQVAAHPGIERPAEESFTRAWPDRDEDQLRTGLRYLSAAIERRTRLDIRNDPLYVALEITDESVLANTIPNVGSGCDWCGFKAQCWSRLGGDDELLLADPEGDDGELDFG